MAEAEALQRKKRVRAGHRASATRIQVQITTALGATPPNAERLSMLKLTLEAKHKTLKELDDEIVALVPDEELDTEIQQADECQENIFEALVLINRTLAPISPPLNTARKAECASCARPERCTSAQEIVTLRVSPTQV